MVHTQIGLYGKEGVSRLWLLHHFLSVFSHYCKGLLSEPRVPSHLQTEVFTEGLSRQMEELSWKWLHLGGLSSLFKEETRLPVKKGQWPPLAL